MHGVARSVRVGSSHRYGTIPMTQPHAPGTEITVACGVDRYATVVGEDGVQRFVGNGAVIHLASGLGGPEGAMQFAFGKMREYRHAYGCYELVSFVAALGLPLSAANHDLIHSSAKIVNPAPPEGEPVEDIYGGGPKEFRTVWVDDVPFQFNADKQYVDTTRFVRNRVVSDLASKGNPGRLSLMAMHDAFRAGVFTKADYVAYQAMLGIPVAALTDIPGLDDCEVEWPETPFPDGSFTAKAVAFPKEGRLVSLRQCAGLRGALGDEVLDGTPLVDVQFGNLFAYMYRRFGHPTMSGDDYKDLAGGWLIDSPDPGVFMTVRASLSGGWDAFVPYVLVADGDEAGVRDPDKIPEARVGELKAAYRAMLLDLLRPVGVRDQQFNAMGYVADDDPLLAGGDDEDEGDEDEDSEAGPGFMAERHPSAGWSMPVGVFGNPQWGRLFAVASCFGDGDLVAGMKSLVDMGMERIVADAAGESSNVRVILAAGSYGKAYDEIRARLCLSDFESRLADELAATFRRGHVPDEGFVVPQMSESDMKRAASLARWLDLDHDFVKPYRHYRFYERVQRTLDDLVARFGTGRELPDECEPDLGRWGVTTPEQVAGYPDFLRGRGLPEMAAWAEDLLTKEDGKNVLAAVMGSLHRWAEAGRERAKAAAGQAQSTEGGTQDLSE